MLRVTVELLPFGDESSPQVLGRMEIGNDGSGEVWLGNYNVRRYARDRGSMRTGRVVGHQRRRVVWDLVRKAIEATAGRDG